MIRCDWANGSELEKIYHDNIWGVPNYDSKSLFRMLCLEGMQAGLSWSTILNKMETLDLAFDNFDPDIMINYDDSKIALLLQDPGIIRNKLKVNAVVTNAKAYFEIEKEFESFSDYIWSFVNNEPIINHWIDINEVPSSNNISDLLSKDLKKRGFKFIGTTIVYAFMQATGMIDDHLEVCFVKKESNRIDNNLYKIK